MRSDRIENIVSDFVSKAHGEGSRGGHIIGHTKTGKAVYADKSGHDRSYAHFSHEDHQDAGKLHGAAYSKAHKDFGRAFRSRSVMGSPWVGDPFDVKMRGSRKAMRQHDDASKSHESAAGQSIVIGKTMSGKDIHIGGAGHPKHGSFTAHDHLDAVIRHREMAAFSNSTAQQARSQAAIGAQKNKKTWTERAERHETEAHNHRKNAADHLNSLRHIVTFGDPDE